MERLRESETRLQPPGAVFVRDHLIDGDACKAPSPGGTGILAFEPRP